VVVYCAGAHEENEGSIHPLLGIPVLGSPIGEGVPINTAYRSEQDAGGVNMVVRAARLVEAFSIFRIDKDVPSPN
jgi:hypothetical protein